MKRWATAALLGTGAALVTAGILLGDPESVFMKAIRICLECVGIG